MNPVNKFQNEALAHCRSKLANKQIPNPEMGKNMPIKLDVRKGN